MQRIPNMNVAIQSCGEHQSVVGNSIDVTVRAQGVVKSKWKNCPSIITALKDGNSDVEDCNKQKPLYLPTAVGTWQIIIFCITARRSLSNKNMVGWSVAWNDNARRAISRRVYMLRSSNLPLKLVVAIQSPLAPTHCPEV